ncbi:MAG: CRISPR-associated protein Cas4 [Acidobacteriaceae bacterium]|nr:CRISPR-associated protein Cas4 [Acidobacteriaceae bacterium]MBV9500074.1 CRISPR-associated protein Cas4 [Acidobacteriaceae bacterium]
MELIPVTDLKQWVYCPRIVYYHWVMPAVGRPTFKMREALAAQDLVEVLEMRRGLRAYGMEGARRHFHVWLSDERLGLSGKADLLLESVDQVAVVDFKLTSGEPGQNHRMQLAGYSLLAEAAYGVPARVGLLYRIPDNRVFTIEITRELREAVLAAIDGVRNMAETQCCPPPTSVRGRCMECEFANYCADIW